MIIVKNKQLLDRAFQTAANSLEQYRLTVPVAYNIMRTNRHLKTALAESTEFYVATLKKYTQLDESGNFVPMKKEDGSIIPNTYVPMEGKVEELEKELQVFMNMDIEIKSFPVKISDLADIPISAATLQLLDGTVIVESV